MEACIKAYDVATQRVVEKKGKLYIVFGEEPDTYEIEAVKVRIAKDDNDPRTEVYASYNGFKVYIPLGGEIVIPKMIYDNVLIKGNLKDRTSKI